MTTNNSTGVPLRSVHTTNFPQLLQQLGISLVISTHRADKLVLVRSDGQTLNTHFRAFNQPMGLAVDREKLALGTCQQIWEFRNSPEVGQKIQPQGQHDACYLPRRSQITGNIHIPEMAYAGNELWFINTRFSCLCTLDGIHSFVPRWRPQFVTAYDATDRCHLNGLGIRDDQPRYATALGATDTNEGWRANQAAGGVLIDIPTHKILCRGLSMPHSPRWYAEQLWVLESGQGSLVRVDPQTGTWQTVAELPGFTRGLDFWGPLAFIGLSCDAEFSSLPLTQRRQNWFCGLWVVNIHTGEIVAMLRFEAAIREIFAVGILPGIRYPELIDWDEERLNGSFMLPDAALRELAIPALAAPSDTIPSNTPPTPSPVDSLAVIVPTFNLERLPAGTWQRTLLSIEASLAHFRQQSPQGQTTICEIVIVDDASMDNTWKLLQEYTSGKPDYRLVRHPQNRGQAAARNTGVKACKAKALLFCDDDNCYRPEHVLTVVSGLNTPLPAGTSSRYALAGNYPGAVKTGVAFSDPVHPDWRGPICSVLPLNLGIRREAHEFIGGFPEDPVFRDTIDAQEDYAYSQWLTHFFNVLWVDTATVEYQRHPGNRFDRQLAKFQRAAGENTQPLPKSEQRYQQQIEQLIREHLAGLEIKLQRFQERDRLLEMANQAFIQERLSEAEACYTQCLRLDPNFLVARYNLGVVYLGQERWSEAEATLQAVTEIDPHHAAAHNNLGLLTYQQGQLETAKAHFRRAIAAEPNAADAHLNLALVLLHAGEYAEGWQEYEWRLKTPQVPPLNCPYPRWDGTPQPQATILIHTEQGSGDAIQFARYLPLVRQQFQRLLLVCIPELADLLGTVAGVDQVVLPGDIPLSAFQTYRSMMSLPLLFKTDAATIPQTFPYLQVPQSSTQWRLPPPRMSTPRLKIGIVWAGSPTHKDDRRRSCRLAELLPVFELPELAIYSLQKRLTPLEQSQLRELGGIDLSEQLQTFADTAAAISQLDLVITVDTSVAHLAGALGAPVWTLLCFCPDWRWGLQGETSPWYPTMRLFRQPKPGDWSAVFKQVQQALANWQSPHRFAP